MFPWIELNFGLWCFWLSVLNQHPSGMGSWFGEWSLYFMSSQMNEVTLEQCLLKLGLEVRKRVWKVKTSTLEC